MFKKYFGGVVLQPPDYQRVARLILRLGESAVLRMLERRFEVLISVE